jgi:hypothetical protein
MIEAPLFIYNVAYRGQQGLRLLNRRIVVVATDADDARQQARTTATDYRASISVKRQRPASPDEARSRGTVVIFSDREDAHHDKAHDAVARGIVSEARVVTHSGFVLFRAWRYGSPTQYAWKTSSMAAPAFWPTVQP